MTEQHRPDPPDEPDEGHGHDDGTPDPVVPGEPEPDDGGTPPAAGATPLDPREARRRHRARHEPTQGMIFLRTLADQERAWMEGMVARTAAAYKVDPDDLLQDLQEGLIHNDSIDSGRTEFRGWLTRRARWKACDIVRKDQLRRRRNVSLEAAGTDVPAGGSPEGRTDPDREPFRLAGLGLNRDEIQTVGLILWGLDVSQQELAILIDKSYAKVRQDRSRALRKIAGLFELDKDEYDAFVAHRVHGSVMAAAKQLDVSELALRRSLRRARQKIERVLGRIRPSDERRDEADSDAL